MAAVVCISVTYAALPLEQHQRSVLAESRS
jgi:hypothetical protein